MALGGISMGLGDMPVTASRTAEDTLLPVERGRFVGMMFCFLKNPWRTSSIRDRKESTFMKATADWAVVWGAVAPCLMFFRILMSLVFSAVRGLRCTGCL